MSQYLKMLLILLVSKSTENDESPKLQYRVLVWGIKMLFPNQLIVCIWLQQRAIANKVACIHENLRFCTNSRCDLYLECYKSLCPADVMRHLVKKFNRYFVCVWRCIRVSKMCNYLWPYVFMSEYVAWRYGMAWHGVVWCGVVCHAMP